MHRGLSPSPHTTSPRPASGAGALCLSSARVEPSGVGALAVVGALLLARAALATGLAHGVLLEVCLDRSLSQEGCPGVKSG